LPRSTPARLLRPSPRQAKRQVSTTKKVARALTVKVLTYADQVYRGRILSVEEIQDIVEEVLLTSPYRRTAKSYIIYREQHAKMRQLHNSMDIDLINQYLMKHDWRVSENSNMDYSLQGLNNYISSEVSKTYWLDEIYTPEIGSRTWMVIFTSTT